MQSPCHYLVVDLEATCNNDGSFPRHEMEIIEIGAVMVEAASLEPVAEFQTFVRPQRHPRLTDFCRELTSIAQSDVDAAPPFPEVLKKFVDWAAGFAEPLFCSWGDYDRKQLQRDCAFHNVAYPRELGHLNLKNRFAERTGIRRRLGLAEALKRSGLQFSGTHHRGIDDARNIARLLPQLVDPPAETRTD